MLTAKTAYITTDEADIYFQGKLFKDAWLEADMPDRRAALIEATTILDQIDYISQKAVNTQEHEFPRYAIFPQFDNVTYDSDNVPFQIKYATAELALALLDGFERDKSINTNNIYSQAYGLNKVIYDRTGLSPHAKAGITPEVWIMIQPLVKDFSSIELSRV